jgi:C4-dicarboxylate transporter DctQ subunit
MTPTMVRAGAWLRRRAENALALMLGAMFIAFLLQIVFRYFLNWPTG